MPTSGNTDIEATRDEASRQQPTGARVAAPANISGAWQALTPAREERKRVSANPALPPGARPPEPPADLVGALESLLFVAEEPVEPAFLASALNVGVGAVRAALETLAERFRERGIRVQQGNGRVQLISAPEFGPYVERFLGSVAEQRLSNAALETLAIVAYRQPVTRSAIEQIRGVNSERALATLRARDLVQEVDRAETVGHPVLFGTTMRFLEYFGLEHSGELPPLGDGDANQSRQECSASDNRPEESGDE
jgi:segregation and condensation protein B